MVFNSHLFFFFLFFDFKIISYMPLMNIGFSRWNDSVFCTSEERLIHLILVSQFRHLVALWGIRIATKPILLSSFCLLGSFNPLFIVCKHFMALLSFLHELSFLWTYMLVRITIINWSEWVGDFILAINSKGLPHLHYFFIFIVVYHFCVTFVPASKNKIEIIKKIKMLTQLHGQLAIFCCRNNDRYWIDIYTLLCLFCLHIWSHETAI